MLNFFRHVPVWVFPLLLWLLVAGARQTRHRELSLSRAIGLPLVMILISVSRLLTAQTGVLPVAGWLFGVMTTALLCARLAWPAGLALIDDGRKVQLPGSVLPLIAMLTIFATRFAAGVLQAREPALAGSPGVLMTFALVSGLASGIFFARFVAILRLRRGTPDTTSGAI